MLRKCYSSLHKVTVFLPRNDVKFIQYMQIHEKLLTHVRRAYGVVSNITADAQVYIQVHTVHAALLQT